MTEEQLITGSRNLLLAIKRERGGWWPCGHQKTWRNTQTVAGVSRCRECRRQRWDEQFVKIVNRKRIEAITERVANKATQSQPRMWPKWYKPQGPFFCGEMLESVAHDFDLTREAMIGPSRDRLNVKARAVAAKILRQRGWSFPQIAKTLNRNDHSTIMHACNMFSIYAERDCRMMDSFMRHGGRS